MDSLPEELVVNIFKHLPATDVLHSRLLSKWYDSIIQKYRNQLKTHEISLELAFQNAPVPEGEPGVQVSKYFP